MTSGTTGDVIELRVDEIAQLFQTWTHFRSGSGTLTAKRRNLS
jgi:hypothetical protein